MQLTPGDDAMTAKTAPAKAPSEALLLEIATFEALEARCGELHAKLLDDPTDRRLEALYGVYCDLWELCRGLTTDD